MVFKEQLKEIRENVWELPKTAKPGMRVPTRLFLSKKLLADLEDGAIEQIANVAFLPGIHKHSIALPDMHFGYGFPIGGVAALDYENGGLSPGGIGFDINCGVRMLRTNLKVDDVKPKLQQILDAVFKNVPSGVGKKGKMRLTTSQLKGPLERGVAWAVDEGYGKAKDIDFIEEKGSLAGADASKVSNKALKRGAPQLGTLGAGNHFLEIQRIEKIFLPDVAKAFGIREEGQIMFMIHSGSRGFGHQVCTDYLQILERAFRNEMSKLPDRELVYAPAGTKECDDYFGAMACGANFAWTNRHMIMHWVRESIQKTLGLSEEETGIEVMYDVAHNIGKIEEHEIDGKRTKVYIHRKGATRALGPGADDLPSAYKGVGQPALVPGSMGTASYVLVGTDRAKEETFSSVCHGAGRMQSRSKALRTYRGEAVKKALGDRGILVRSASWKVLAEEAPGVYKDVDEVVRVCQDAGIARIVAKMRPMGVVKG
jgi:tRNA-splicing ligase RtcB